jgi:hypothetical protein
MNSITGLRLAGLVSAFLFSNGPAFCQDEDGLIARKEWQAQVDRSRQRVDQIRREGTFIYQEQETSQEEIREQINRALDDDGLRPGDVVSTNDGFLRFEGTSPDNKRIFSPLKPQAPYRR